MASLFSRTNTASPRTRRGSIHRRTVSFSNNHNSDLDDSSDPTVHVLPSSDSAEPLQSAALSASHQPAGQHGHHRNKTVMSEFKFPPQPFTQDKRADVPSIRVSYEPPIDDVSVLSLSDDPYHLGTGVATQPQHRSSDHTSPSVGERTPTRDTFTHRHRRSDSVSARSRHGRSTSFSRDNRVPTQDDSRLRVPSSSAAPSYGFDEEAPAFQATVSPCSHGHPGPEHTKRDLRVHYDDSDSEEDGEHESYEEALDDPTRSHSGRTVHRRKTSRQAEAQGAGRYEWKGKQLPYQPFYSSPAQPQQYIQAQQHPLTQPYLPAPVYTFNNPGYPALSQQSSMYNHPGCVVAHHPPPPVPAAIPFAATGHVAPAGQYGTNLVDTMLQYPRSHGLAYDSESSFSADSNDLSDSEDYSSETSATTDVPSRRKLSVTAPSFQPQHQTLHGNLHGSSYNCLPTKSHEKYLAPQGDHYSGVHVAGSKQHARPLGQGATNLAKAKKQLDHWQRNIRHVKLEIRALEMVKEARLQGVNAGSLIPYLSHVPVQRAVSHLGAAGGVVTASGQNIIGLPVAPSAMAPLALTATLSARLSNAALDAQVSDFELKARRLFMDVAEGRKRYPDRALAALGLSFGVLKHEQAARHYSLAQAQTLELQAEQQKLHLMCKLVEFEERARVWQTRYWKGVNRAKKAEAITATAAAGGCLRKPRAGGVGGAC
ncbi:hypothetical protein DL93DRAFT_2100585 [Clavulina sp. PMI_390]|nr:hypothetical protein DL93DRAFT_2100585 [Clavulina sp. PMI_390]